ncbi:ABC transporter substrate-binding protein [Halalkalicoccus jeotgali]|uniref:Ferrichrome-binding protein n=1 Tax=Halalkalicoccus jeotgali (strain DSM 18796 / CECT 7217 / JCM 14584 / KCTC 4019 / B3) TaxID=795797 RepID=D8J875_HALJB|nr:ABC transporter substrate-binding protein [Halalkalicoccus jeotgali]ADJ14188.1 ferrichrome-binding protein [Halalkalicoccus jeotgali B3]ELY34630.1 ferrichrome-binding protein [Halalkalicoccus jeotgali B3]
MAGSSRGPTRREVLVSGGSAAGLALAGCTGGDGDGDGNGSSDDGGGGGGSYTVSMEPVGEVTFESPPERWVANNGSWADMGVALGHEPPEALWLTSRYHTRYYDGIPDVSVDTSGMTDLYQNGVDKELFYELDADVHVIDPNFLLNRYSGWEQADIDEIDESVGPFFGNSIFSQEYAWHDDYQYYTLYEAFGKLAEAFQEQERYEQFVALHEEFQGRVEEIVPPEGERPEVAILWADGDQPETFLPYLISEGTSFKQWRDLGVRDALANSEVEDFHTNRGELDFETLLEVDPEVLLLRGQEGKTASEFQDTVVSFLENDDVASRLTAVQNGDVYRGGPLYQGPITNLVLTERAAGQVYGIEEELFDRDEVAGIVTGQ